MLGFSKARHPPGGAPKDTVKKDAVKPPRRLVGRGALAQVAGDPDDVVLFATPAKIYPKAVHGIARKIKWAVLVFCLSIYYLLPWVRWDRGPAIPDQAVLLDVTGRRFYFFNLEIWPQEIYFLTGILITASIALFLVTSIAGRLWCGYACPQTVWTDLFLWVERLLEGDRPARMRRDARPMSFNKASLDKALRKLAKHSIWFLIALATGGVWITYYVDAPTLVVEFFTGQSGISVYFLVGLFTMTTYLLAGWAREQVCTYMCPWPRFQSAMFDEQTITVSYQAWRGETRAPYKAGQSWEGRGDCIDCGQCIAACPTGIDIRDGAQLECINCGLCIDACDDIMRRVGRPVRLITWDSLAHQEALLKTGCGSTTVPRTRLIRPRSLLYVTLLAAVGSVMLYALLTRSNIWLAIEHDQAPMAIRLSDGSIRNGYTLKITNKSLEPREFLLTSQGVADASLLAVESKKPPGDQLTLSLDPHAITSFRVFVQATKQGKASRPVLFVIRDPKTGQEETCRSVFVEPSV